MYTVPIKFEDLDQKTAFSEHFIAVPTIPSMPIFWQHGPKLSRLHNEFIEIAI